MSECELCDLPTPDPPVTDEEVDGAFCCRGCLEVSRTLGEEEDSGADVDPETVRRRLDDERGEASEPPAEAFLHVEGMHCAACEAFVESCAVAADGIELAEANYPTDTMRVGYDPENIAKEDLDELVDAGGYETVRMDEAAERDGDDGDRMGRLLVGGFFGMQAMLWYVLFLYPTYAGLGESLRLFGLDSAAGRYLLANLWVSATVVLGFTGAPLLRNAWVSLRARRPNMDLLVALASTTAYLYSTLGLLLGRSELYFDVTIVIVLVVTVGGYYEDRIRRRAAGTLGDRTRERVREVRRLPTDAHIGATADAVSGNDEDNEAGDATTTTAVADAETVDVTAVEPRDNLLVTEGERVPLDGRVVAGDAAVDASLVTGESLPERRTAGENVIGGSVVADGHLVVEVGEESKSTRERVQRLLWAAQTGRPGVQRLADRIAARFVPAVVVLALLTAGAHLALGATPTGALLTSLAVLVVSCPCALGLATPLAVASGIRTALEHDVVCTKGEVFEAAEEAEILAFDKTGTLTTGDPRILDTMGAPAVGPRAAAVEALASHPVATAISERFDPPEATVEDFRTHPGLGVEARIDGERVVVGRLAMFDEEGVGEGAENAGAADGEHSDAQTDWSVPERYRQRAHEASEAGRIPSLVGWSGEVRGVIVAGDEPRAGWREAVAAAAERVERVIVLTGDGEAAARPVREHPDVDRVFAELPPEGKTRAVERLCEEGVTAMVGDGSNDAPALATADLGVALASGTDLAADAADAVVLDGDLGVLPEIFDLTRVTRQRVRENLAWAFCYNAVALPLAATGLLSPLLAAVAMGASSLLVVANSARPLLRGEAETGRPAEAEQAAEVTHRGTRPVR